MDQATPPRLDELNRQWVDSQVFLDFWRPDWKTTFTPLYASTPHWQRLWCAGRGRPGQESFLRGDLLCQMGLYSDRLCVPCPKARIEILTRLHGLGRVPHRRN